MEKQKKKTKKTKIMKKKKETRIEKGHGNNIVMRFMGNEFLSVVTSLLFDQKQ